MKRIWNFIKNRFWVFIDELWGWEHFSSCDLGSEKVYIIHGKRNKRSGVIHIYGEDTLDRKKVHVIESFEYAGEDL